MKRPACGCAELPAFPSCLGRSAFSMLSQRSTLFPGRKLNLSEHTGALKAPQCRMPYFQEVGKLSLLAGPDNLQGKIKCLKQLGLKENIK